MPVITVNRAVDKKRIIGQMEDQGEGKAQRVHDSPLPPKRPEW
jgi:hypothetical protein